jgi:hypothetical protein
MYQSLFNVFSLPIEGREICSWQAWRNAIFLRRMHLFVNNIADPDISDYEFDADDLFRRQLYCIWKFHGINCVEQLKLEKGGMPWY